MHIKDTYDRIKASVAIEKDENLDAVSWTYQEWILISKREAMMFIELMEYVLPSLKSEENES